MSKFRTGKRRDGSRYRYPIAKGSIEDYFRELEVQKNLRETIRAEYIDVPMSDGTRIKVPDVDASPSELDLYAEILDDLKNDEIGDLPTKKKFVGTCTEADLIAKALVFTTGGAEIETVPNGFYVWSKGHKEYGGGDAL